MSKSYRRNHDEYSDDYDDCKHYLENRRKLKKLKNSNRESFLEEPIDSKDER